MVGRLRFVRRTLGLAVLCLSAGMLLWGVWPFPQVSESIALGEGHRQVLSWPATARTGDVYSVRMQIEADSPTQPSGSTTGILAVEENSNAMAEARLEFAGLLFYPGEMSSQPLQPGRPLSFRWQFRPEAQGEYNGVAWLHFHDVPRDGSPETVTPVSASEIQIRAADLFGLNGPAARLLGVTGILVGGLLSLDRVLAWMQKRARRSGAAQPAQEFVEQ